MKKGMSRVEPSSLSKFCIEFLSTVPAGSKKLDTTRDIFPWRRTATVEDVSMWRTPKTRNALLAKGAKKTRNHTIVVGSDSKSQISYGWDNGGKCPTGGSTFRVV